GKLYGSVDFAIVQADVNLTVTLTAQVRYESFADIALSASASVSISVTIKIDLGLFSIHISFSFSATITADATIQVSDHDPPWYSHELPRRTRGPAAQLAMPLRAPMPRPLAADHD